MKKGVLITMIVCAILFVLGIVFIIVGYVCGATSDFNIDFFEHRISSSGEGELYAGNEEVEAFSDMDINLDASDIKILEGDSYKVEYKLYGNKPVISVENGKLIIKEKNEHKLRFHLGESKKLNPYVNIYVPKGTEFKGCKMDVDAGNVQIENQTIDNLDIDADAGNINIQSSALNTFTFDGAAGNIVIDNTKMDSMKADVDYGDVKISDSEIKAFKLDTDAGNTEISSTRMDEVDITADAGNIELGLIGEAADYSIDAKVDFGKLTLNGEKQGSKINQTGKSGKSIKIDSDAGDVDIDI